MYRVTKNSQCFLREATCQLCGKTRANDATSVTHRFPHTRVRTFHESASRDAFGSVAIRNSRPLAPATIANFLSHRRNSHEIVSDFVIRPIVGISPACRAALCARSCVRARGSRRVQLHAPGQFYGANIIAVRGAVRFPFRREHARVRVREHFLLARSLCAARGRDCSLFRRFPVTGL